MEMLQQAIYTALRDDNPGSGVAGLRILLGKLATPFGVYQDHMPEAPDFGGGDPTWDTYYWGTFYWGQPVKSGYLVLSELSKGPGLASTRDASTRLREMVVVATCYHPHVQFLNRILRRTENVLEGARKITLPTS